MTEKHMNTSVVLFDGVCNLCTWSVQFILRRDPQGYFRFAALQSPVGQQLLQMHGYSSTVLSSVVLIEQDRVYTSSDAALRIARHLNGWWPFVNLLRVVPRPIRDTIYQWIATHRYRWFGQRDTCMIAPPGARDRFLDAGTSSED